MRGFQVAKLARLVGAIPEKTILMRTTTATKINYYRIDCNASTTLVLGLGDDVRLQLTPVDYVLKVYVHN
jgi:hypothetical protein